MNVRLNWCNSNTDSKVWMREEKRDREEGQIAVFFFVVSLDIYTPVMPGFFICMMLVVLLKLIRMSKFS